MTFLLFLTLCIILSAVSALSFSSISEGANATDSAVNATYTGKLGWVQLFEDTDFGDNSAKIAINTVNTCYGVTCFDYKGGFATWYLPEQGNITRTSQLGIYMHMNCQAVVRWITLDSSASTAVDLSDLHNQVKSVAVLTVGQVACSMPWIARGSKERNVCKSDIATDFSYPLHHNPNN